MKLCQVEVFFTGVLSEVWRYDHHHCCGCCTHSQSILTKEWGNESETSQNGLKQWNGSDKDNSVRIGIGRGVEHYTPQKAMEGTLK